MFFQKLDFVFFPSSLPLRTEKGMAPLVFFDKKESKDTGVIVCVVVVIMLLL